MAKVNLKLIRNSAIDTVKYLKKDEPEIFTSYEIFLTEGAKAPCIANRYMIDAFHENSLKMTELFKAEKAEYQETVDAQLKLPHMLKNYAHYFKPELDTFEASYKKMYPKTYHKRKAIENFYLNYTLYPATTKVSTKKWLKKILVFLSKINKLD